MAADTGAKPQTLTLTTREAADLLGVHIVTLRRWAHDGTIPSVKVGAKRLISRRWLEDFLAVGSGEVADDPNA